MSQTSDKILDTAAYLFLNRDVDKVTMEDIAKEAEIGRATIYRHFKNRDELLISLMEREARIIATEIQLKIDESENIVNPGDYVVEGMVLAVDAVENNALFHYVFRSGTIQLNRLLFLSDKLTTVGLDIMLPVVENAKLGDIEMDFEMLMEWILRMLISFITVPSPKIKTPEDLRDMLRKTMLPVLNG